MLLEVFNDERVTEQKTWDRKQCSKIELQMYAAASQASNEIGQKKRFTCNIANMLDS